MFARFNITFTPDTCYTPGIKPCNLLKKSYTVMPTKASGAFPPPELAPGEYITDVFGVPTKGGDPVLIATRMIAVGTK